MFEEQIGRYNLIIFVFDNLIYFIINISFSKL